MRLDPYGRAGARVSGRRTYIAVVVVTWAAIVVAYSVIAPRYVSPLKLPGPASAAAALDTLGTNLFVHGGATLARTCIGFAIGGIVGMATAILMFAMRPVHAAVNPIVEMVRPIPPIALTPFFILWFQLAPSGQIALIALGVFMVFVVSTYEALDQVSPDVRRAAWSLGCTGSGFYRRIMLPAILPRLIAPARVAVALAFALACAAEFLGAQQGIGVLMMVARRTLDTGTLLVGVVMIGLQAALVDWIVRTAVRRATRWHA